MAVDEVNGAGGLEIAGVRHPVEIVERDTRSDVNTAVLGATALVRDDEVKFVIGPATGIETSATQQITQPAGVIELSAASVLQGILSKENAAPDGDKRYPLHGADRFKRPRRPDSEGGREILWKPRQACH